MPERKQVGLPAELVDKIDREAKRLNVSRTGFVEAAVQRMLGEPVAVTADREVLPATEPGLRPTISSARRRARPAYPKGGKR